jgi:hypothetical protein
MTVEVGANDLVERCLRETFRLDRVCAADLLPRMQTRLTHIVDALGDGGSRRADRRYDVVRPPPRALGSGPRRPPLARADQRVWAQLTATFVTAFEDAGVTVAGVAATFQVDDFTDTVVVPGRGELPMNVANTCLWTWFCSPRFAGDPNANAIGYRKIADTFEQELQALLP